VGREVTCLCREKALFPRLGESRLVILSEKPSSSPPFHLKLGALGFVLSVSAWAIEVPLSSLLQVLRVGFWADFHRNLLGISFFLLFVSFLLIGIACFEIKELYETNWAVLCSILSFLTAGLMGFTSAGVVGGAHGISLAFMEVFAFFLFNLGQFSWAFTVSKCFVSHPRLVAGATYWFMLSGILGVSWLPAAFLLGTFPLFLSMSPFVVGAALSIVLLLSKTMARS